MEFRFDDAQVELQNTVARFCADHFPIDALAGRETAPVDRRVWSALAELGVFGLAQPEAAGGSGLGIVEAAIVFEQLGAHLAPGPVLWSFLAAGLVDGAIDGSCLVSGAEQSAVDGGAVVVAHATEAEALLIVGDDAVAVHDVSGLRCEQLDGLDPLAPVGQIQLGQGRILGDGAAARRLTAVGATLNAAMLVGIAMQSLEVARRYALERRQFGVPIGSFQAVKHILADMFVRANVAHSATYAAAAMLDDPAGADTTDSVGAARLLAGEAAIDNASAAVQVLGGMGFTWDMLPNYLLKRAWSLDQDFADR